MLEYYGYYCAQFESRIEAVELSLRSADAAMPGPSAGTRDITCGAYQRGQVQILHDLHARYEALRQDAAGLNSALGTSAAAQHPNMDPAAGATSGAEDDDREDYADDDPGENAALLSTDDGNAHAEMLIDVLLQQIAIG
ncbi:hypothetical protein WJX72_011783 [[Myrmecia] bisecta]|uniref:Uncharacterized protein n=1 Tax=[Myrmecia] bisecta TaxID=41462 RepID=A0AAW1Q7Z2_9CHLO